VVKSRTEWRAGLRREYTRPKMERLPWLMCCSAQRNPRVKERGKESSREKLDALGRARDEQEQQDQSQAQPEE
jgi:hypothetical protein